MNRSDAFDRHVSEWLHADAEHRVPEHLDAVLRRTRTERQRPAWSSLERWLPVDLTAQARFAGRPTLGKALLVAAILVALIGIALFAVGSRIQRVPPPFGLAANGQITYSANGDIFVSDADGKNAKSVVSGPSDDFVSGYTRDGTQLTFLRASSPHESMVMIGAPDGSGVRPLLKDPLTDADWFEWSPDSRSLAVVHTVTGKRVLSIVDVDSGTLRTLDVGGRPVDNSVFWRPGTRSEMIFTSHSQPGDLARAGIFSIDAAGGKATAIVPVVVGPAEFNGVDLAPDGRTLTYWRWEESKGSRIHQLDMVTGDDRELRFDPSSKGETGLLHSPDGSLVLYQHEDSAGQVMIAPPDASRPGIPVGRRFDLNTDPAYGFSPDGKIVFVRFADDAPQFFDAATGAVRAGPATPAECCSWQRLAP
jgi:dipeptidyl aminopeptidase/acylaminoacyl peptidase